MTHNNSFYFSQSGTPRLREYKEQIYIPSENFENKA